MSTSVPVVRDDEYEKFAIAYQCVLIEMMQRALRRSKLEPDQVERAINQFMFELGNFHDDGWLKSDGKRIYPLLCFTKDFLNVDTAIQAIGTINAPSAGYAFHEHAMGLVKSFLAGNNDLRVETGSFGDSD